MSVQGPGFGRTNPRLAPPPAAVMMNASLARSLRGGKASEAAGEEELEKLLTPKKVAPGHRRSMPVGFPPCSAKNSEKEKRGGTAARSPANTRPAALE